MSIDEGALMRMRQCWLLAGLACGLLAGSPAIAQADLTVVDARTDKVEKTRILSLFVGSCTYAVYKLGDAGRKTDRISLLEADLEAGLGPEYAGKTVEVVDYRGYMNAGQSGKRAAAAVGIGGAVGGAAGDAMAKSCDKETEREGWYIADETRNGFSPFITNITVRIDGQSYTIRNLYSPTLELSPASRTLWIPTEGMKQLTDDKAAPEVEAAYRAANQQLILEIRKNAAPPQDPPGR